MNTHAEHRRNNHQPTESAAPATTPETEAANHLAVHGDPSLATAGPTTANARTAAAGRVALVRPTELASFASPLIGRGIDLHAELVHRAQQAPRTLARSVRHYAPRAAAAPVAEPTNRQEGIKL
jgi:hypothetical protein